MTTAKNIFHYRSIVEVLQNHLENDKFVTLSEHAKDVLLGVDDYEAIEYIVMEHRPPISHTTVIAFDSISGDVLFNETLDELFIHTVDFLKEEE